MPNAFFTMPRAGWIISGASFLALLTVFTLQYGFDVQPCILCWWQRLPVALTLIASLVAVLWRPYGAQTKILLALCAVIFIAGSSLALFHTGVEQHWWLGTSGCAITPLKGNSVEDLRTQLLHTVVAHCDQISWTLLGFSLANWNIVFSIAMAFFAALATRRVSK